MVFDLPNNKLDPESIAFGTGLVSETFEGVLVVVGFRLRSLPKTLYKVYRTAVVAVKRLYRGLYSSWTFNMITAYTDPIDVTDLTLIPVYLICIAIDLLTWIINSEKLRWKRAKRLRQLCTLTSIQTAQMTVVKTTASAEEFIFVQTFDL